MKTDLAKTLTISGQRGLFQYIAQARNGVIAQSLKDGKRMVFDAKRRITTLADIAIYTESEELKLSEVFLALQKTLDGAKAPSSKSSDSELKELFAKAVPNYDSDRFYVSHMKKVVDWYNELVEFASLDFVSEETEE